MISSILHPSLASHSHTPTLFHPLSRMLSMLFTFLSVLIATAVADTDQIPSELKVDVYEGIWSVSATAVAMRTLKKVKSIDSILERGRKRVGVCECEAREGCRIEDI